MKERKEYKCKNCGDKFLRLESQASKTPFCCRECYWKSKKGQAPHNKGFKLVFSKKCAVCGARISGEQSEVRRRKYCSTKCTGAAKAASAADIKSYISERVQIDNNGCWNWAKSLNGGYARFRINGKSVYGHRASYEAYIGEIPDGLFLDHLCRNRKCLNPDHLEPVTTKENIRRGEAGYQIQPESVQKKRSESLKKHYSDPKNRERQAKILAKSRASEKRKKAHLEAIQRPEYRKRASEQMKAIWAERKRLANAIDD